MEEGMREIFFGYASMLRTGKALLRLVSSETMRSHKMLSQVSLFRLFPFRDRSYSARVRFASQLFRVAEHLRRQDYRLFSGFQLL